MKNLELHEININNAFIESFLKEIIYIFSSLKVKVRFNYALKIL